MKFVRLSILILALGVSASLAAQEVTNPFAKRDALALRATTPNQTSVPRYGKLELALDLSAAYDNPFDPNDIDVFAVFTSPGGTAIRVNAFLDQPFARTLVGEAERIDPAGDPAWRVRFSPSVVGDWRYVVHVRDRSGEASLPEASFTVTDSPSPGFIRRSEKNPFAFACENGQPFFAVGENLCWGGPGGSFTYDTWLNALGAARANWIRIWMWSWSCALEWTPENVDGGLAGYHGLGVYNLANAWKLDTILDAAERNGVNVMLCFGTYGEFNVGGYFNEGQWKANPYNTANGGPCAEAKDFWANEQARKMYQRRLRYLAARYGYRTNLFAWEFWNEAKAPTLWVAEMAAFLKSADPYSHLVSTTYGDAEVWPIPDVDFTMSHHYGTGNIPDSAPIIHGDALGHATFGKPHLMAEFGIDWRSADDKYDPDGIGVNLHNGLWASALSGNAGGAMLWYWDGYVHPKNLYGQFTALRAFTDTVPWASCEWKQLDAGAPRVSNGPEVWKDLVLKPGIGWGGCPMTDFEIRPDERPDGGPMPSFLYSPGKADMRTTPTFRVNYHQPGRFELKVDTVSAAAHLRILLDGASAFDKTLSANPPTDPNVAPEYESTEFIQQYGIHQAKFNKSYGIDVPAGAHTIVLEVTEGDWLSVAEYVLTGYTNNRFPDVQLYGLTNGQEAILWAHNGEYNWKNVLDKKPIAPVQGAQVALRGLPAGEYTIEWWDTWKGGPTENGSATCADNALPLSLPDIQTDVAAHIRPTMAK